MTKKTVTKKIDIPVSIERFTEYQSKFLTKKPNSKPRKIKIGIVVDK